jgi:phage protein D
LNTLECTIDEIQVDGPPSTVTIRAIGAANTKQVRTTRSRAFEDTTLKAIAATIAGQNGLTIMGDIPDIHWARVSQWRETDLAFLRRIGKEHLLAFNVKGKNLVLYDTQALESRGTMLTVGIRDLTRYSFREKVIHGSVQACYFDRETKQLNSETLTIPERAHPNIKKVKHRTENKTQTQRVAKAALHDTKAWERDGTLTLPGDVRARAGGNLELTSDFGVLAGIWQIRQGRHMISRDKGYETELEIRHVAS